MRLLLLLLLLGEGPVINLGPAFQEFWTQAAGRPVAEQRRLFQEILEAPHQAFYRSLVGASPAQLDASLEKLPQLVPEMTRLFADFGPTLETQCARFQEVFPNFRREVPVYLVPAAGRFNGMAGMVDDQLVLAFGADLMVTLHDDPAVLYSHELFHVYHKERMGLTETQTLQAPLGLALWVEGLACYVSHQLNPQADLARVLNDPTLARVSAEDRRWLAECFLHWSQVPRGDERGHALWFRYGSQERLRPDLPPRCGYLLGYLVARELAQDNTLDALAHWPLEMAMAQVETALRRLSQNN